jgi:hypothetical protein
MCQVISENFERTGLSSEAFEGRSLRQNRVLKSFWKLVGREEGGSDYAAQSDKKDPKSLWLGVQKVYEASNTVEKGRQTLLASGYMLGRWSEPSPERSCGGDGKIKWEMVGGGTDNGSLGDGRGRRQKRR